MFIVYDTNILRNIFNNIKIKDLKQTTTFNIVSMLQDSEKRTWKYYESKNKESYFDNFDDRDVNEMIEGNEGILMEYLRRLIIR
jgi:hypothetical protein